MTRLALAASALLLATFATGCGGRHYRARYVYVQGPPVAVLAVRGPMYAPPPAPPAPPMPPPPAAGPQTIVVHAPPGSVVIVNPQGGRPQVVQPQSAPPQEAPDAPEQPEAPPVEPQDQGWFQGGR
jgi:hypothetical protein